VHGSIVVTGSTSLFQVYSLGIGGNDTGTLDVSDGGIVRVKLPFSLNYGLSGTIIGSRGTVTLDDGIIELNGSTGGTLDFYTQPSYSSAPQGVRGNGTIRRAPGATGLSTVNNGTYNISVDGTSNYHGILRPGDTTLTPAVGTIAIEDANYTSTLIAGSKAGTQKAELYLDLASPTSYDQLLLTDPGTNDGVVTATLAGSIFFNNINAIDFTAHTTIDFVRAENIIDGGYTTPNLAATAAGWTYNGLPDLAYTLGIVTVGPNDVRLRLTVIPEPASLALLALGGVLISRRTRRGV
jgi:hypothetical protein